MADLLSVEEALAIVLEHARPLPAEDVALDEAAGRVLAEPAHAAVDLPPFPSSAMDGFARSLRRDARAGSGSSSASAAGRPAERPLEPGEAIGIATGAVVPEGADAVVPIENVIDDGSSVQVAEAVRPGENVRGTRRRHPRRRRWCAGRRAYRRRADGCARRGRGSRR